MRVPSGLPNVSFSNLTSRSLTTLRPYGTQIYGGCGTFVLPTWRPYGTRQLEISGTFFSLLEMSGTFFSPTGRDVLR